MVAVLGGSLLSASAVHVSETPHQDKCSFLAGQMWVEGKSVQAATLLEGVNLRLRSWKLTFLYQQLNTATGN